MADNGTEFEPVTLSNVAEGELERQFQECLIQVMAALEEAYEYEPTGHMIKAKIPMVVEFSKSLETGVMLIGVRASYTPPKRKAALRAAFLKDGAILVEQAEQIGFLERGEQQGNVLPITKPTEDRKE